MTVNAQYNVARPNSLPIRVAAFQRRRMFSAFLKLTGIGADDTVLDVGATSDRSYDHSNYLVAWYGNRSRITAVGIDDASFLETAYPGVTFIQANGLHLPFDDNTYDYIHSSAVLEHVGSSANQAKFLREAWRVARKGVFITTPNRWFPIEFHTVLPFIHWLPKPVHRKILLALNKAFFADENNLNLLSAGELRNLAGTVGISRHQVSSVSLLGWPTNLLLIAAKIKP